VYSFYSFSSHKGSRASFPKKLKEITHPLAVFSALLLYFYFERTFLSYRRAHFTPPDAKYLILDDFHFRIDPQIINYNGLSFHTSMGLSELGRAVARRPLSRPPGSAAVTPTVEQPQLYSLSKSKSRIDGHMLVCNSRLFIETKFPVSLSDSKSRSAQAKD